MLARNVTVDDMKRMGMPVPKGDTMSPTPRPEVIGHEEIAEMFQTLDLRLLKSGIPKVLKNDLTNALITVVDKYAMAAAIDREDKS